MKVRVYVSGYITERDGKRKDVLVCEREDGERLEVVLTPPYDFDKEANKLIELMKTKPKRELPKTKEIEI